MASTFDLDTYKCDPLPPKLWRVTHPSSQSWESPFGDFLAADFVRQFSDKEGFKEAVEKHFDWGNRDDSCFLSVFSSLSHALRWAEQRAEKHGQYADVEECCGGDARNCVYISEIDTANLRVDTYVFDSASLVIGLDIDDYEYSADELLFLHYIPFTAIMKTRSLASYPSRRTPLPSLHSLHGHHEDAEPRIIPQREAEISQIIDEYHPAGSHSFSHLLEPAPSTTGIVVAMQLATVHGR